MEHSIKATLYQTCQDHLQKKLEAIEARLKDLEESMGAETKSSVGDKYETGRAMLHLEKDKQMQQLATLLDSKKALNTVPVSEMQTVGLGALVQTNKGFFYIAISIGKLKVNGVEYFSISLGSPIGQVLLNKKVGDSFGFNGVEYLVLGVV